MSEESTVTVSEGSESKTESAIERAMAAVAARKAAKAQAAADKPAKAPKEKKEKVEKPADPEAKAAAKADKAKAREAKQAELKEQRAARKAEREATKAAARGTKKGGAHMVKVDKAAAKLPALNESARLILDEATTNLGEAQVLALAMHMQHAVRAKATARAAEIQVSTGDHVKITGGDPRFIGMTGLIDRAQRIRCYVKVDGRDKPVYCFTSDVVKVTAEA